VSATVLIIASDVNIESLLGELVAFAGHRPVHDVTLGAAGESVRRTCPDILLLDTSLPPAVVTACLQAAREVGALPIIVSSTSSPEELANQAEALACQCFALPGGARPLQEVVERALASRRRVQPFPPPAAVAQSIHPSFRAALASIARARALATRALLAQAEHRTRRDELRRSLDEVRRSHAALRAAVRDFALQLKAGEVPLERIVTIVQGTLADCATMVGAQSAMPALLDESAEWARSAYFAA